MKKDEMKEINKNTEIITENTDVIITGIYCNLDKKEINADGFKECCLYEKGCEYLNEKGCKYLKITVF